MCYPYLAMDDMGYMRRALRLAARARGRTSPNPMVGAVIVKSGRIIAEDYHRKAGTPHAEALAIAAAGEKALGSTLYVTLEPCCHTEKRTPPCADAIVAAGIKRVVAAMKDPNPAVCGKGLEMLQRAGIKTEFGLMEKQAALLNEFYIKYIITNRPFVILKAAMTLDGKIATPEGQSKWITGEKSRALVHKLRSSVDAILTAIGTVRADDPELTARLAATANMTLKTGFEPPLRVVIDPDLEIPPSAKLLKCPPETLIVTRQRGTKSENLEKSGIKMLYFKEKLELDWLLKRLASMGVMSVLVEGGSSLNARAFEEGVIDKVMFFVAPKVIGGRASYPVVGGKSFRGLSEAHRIGDVRVRRVGEDILIEGYLKRIGQEGL